MVRPKKETEDLLLSITRKYEALIKRTHRKREEVLEVKLSQPRQTFRFNPPITVEGSWINGV